MSDSVILVKRYVNALIHYHPRMLVGNVFSCVCLSAHLSVCLSVCLSVACPSVYLSVQAITFDLLHIGTSFLVCRYILTICR